jgi:hypothetical protein
MPSPKEQLKVKTTQGELLRMLPYIDTLIAMAKEVNLQCLECKEDLEGKGIFHDKCRVCVQKGHGLNIPKIETTKT